MVATWRGVKDNLSFVSTSKGKEILLLFTGKGGKFHQFSCAVCLCKEELSVNDVLKRLTNYRFNTFFHTELVRTVLHSKN